MTKSILTVFESAFLLGWRGSTPRILDFAHSLTAEGWNFTLLAGPPSREAPGTEQEQALAGRVVRTPFSLYPHWMRGRILRRLYRDWLTLTNRSRFFKDPESGWPAQAAQWYIKNNLGKPDVVMGMSTGQVGNLTAARILADHYRVPLVLELQDPVPPVSLKRFHPAMQQSLDRCMAAADAVITTTRSLARHLAQRYPACTGSFDTIYMCYDESKPAAAVSSDGPVTILHAGTLYGGTFRNARTVVQGLAAAIQKNPDLRHQLRLELLGAGAGGHEARELGEGLGIGDVISVLPEVPMQQAIARMAMADVLLLIKFSGREFDMQIPGKLYQYMGQGKPILGIMSPTTEAAEILRQSGLGTIVHGDDVDGVVSFLSDIVRHRQHLNERFTPNWEYIRHFSRDEMGKQVNQLLQRLCEMSRNGKSHSRA